MAEKKYKEAEVEFSALAAMPDLPAEFAARVKIDQGYLSENAGLKKEGIPPGEELGGLRLPAF